MENRRTTLRAQRASGRGPAPSAILAVVVAGLGLAGCRATVPISHLLDDPYEFDGRRVKVEGHVTGAVGAFGRGAYTVDDGTGVVIIVSEREFGGVPRAGARVAVTGWFRSLFTLGPVSGAVIVERNRHPRFIP